MKKLRLIAGLLAIVWLAWWWAYPSATVRYRLTLQAEVDGKPVSGFGVIEAYYGKALRLLGASAEFQSFARGQAVMLDLGTRGVLFALLKEGGNPRSSPEQLFFVALGYPYGLGSYQRHVDASMAHEVGPAIRAMAFGTLSGKSGPLAPDQLPLLVRFRDINDPKTVERVDPANLSAAFGHGVRLTAARIDTVPSGLWPFNLLDLPWPQALFGVPITRGIEQRLGWLNNLDRYRTDPANPFTNTLAPEIGGLRSGI
jgi:hypothetical protein